MKSSFYLKHDLDASNDQKMVKMLMKHGARGYGIYWLIIPKLYKSPRLERDYAALSWELREDVGIIKSVVEDFGLFYDADGKIGCRRVDRAITERKEASEQARQAGQASAAKRLNGRSTAVQPGEERRGEEGKEKTDAPSASDFSGHRLNIGGEFKGCYLASLTLDTAKKALLTARPGAKDKEALEWWIAEKELERGGKRSGGVVSAGKVLGAKS